MDDSRAVLRRNPERHANILSRMFFCFVTPIMWRGLRNDLQQEDLYEHLPQDESRLLFERLKSNWESECNRDDLDKKPASLGRAIVATFGRRFAALAGFLMLEESVRMVQPLFIGGLVRYFRFDHPLTANEAYMHAAGITICAAAYPLIHHPYFYQIQKIGMRVKIATSALIFDKALRLSSGALHKTTIGKVVNLLSTDVNKFDFAVLFLHYMFVAPFLLLGYGALLWYVLGPASMAGWFCIVLLMPLQAVFSRKMGLCRRQIAARADKRIGVMSEILNGIRVIKMYAWEAAFGELVDRFRQDELNAVRRFSLWQSMVLGTFWASGRLVILCAVIAYSLAGQNISAETVFVAAALFNSARLPLTLFLPLSIQFLIECKVSIGRMQEFMLLEEFTSVKKSIGFTKTETEDTMLNGYATELSPAKVKRNLSDPSSTYLKLHQCSAKWSDDQESNTLEDVNLDVQNGQLVAIVGAVGAGKSSILQCILGEMRASSGSVDYNGSLAYVPQEAWVFGGTIRQNITFGLQFDEQHYQTVLKTSALNKDLSLMPKGDQTIVGDRGVALSGGQKARLNLARALYRDADIYLLDDPLSAVDAAVGRFLFERCIRSHLRKRTVLLVTHQLQYLGGADCILLLHEGRVVASGDMRTLQQSHPAEFAQVLHETEQSYSKRAKERDRVGSTASSTGSPNPALLHRRPSAQSEGNPDLSASDRLLSEEEQPLAGAKELSESDWSLALGTGEHVEGGAADDSQEEDRNTGAVTGAIYWSYIRAMGPIWKLVPLFAFVVFVQLLMNATDWWLNIWSTASERREVLQRDNATVPDDIPDSSLYQMSNGEYMGVYGGLCASLVVFAILRVLWFRMSEVNASQVLHSRMFRSVVKAKMSFFDVNPTGRVLNRFSKDTGTMDEQLAFVFFDFLQGALLFTSIVIVIGALNPLVFVPTVPIAIGFFGIRYVYLQTSRDVKRLESTTRSPVFSMISATLNGLTAIRAFDAQQAVLHTFHGYQNVYTAAFSMTLSTARWFAGVIDWLVVLYISAVAFTAVLAGKEQHVSSGEAALVLMYSIQLTGFLSWILRQSADLEMGMVSVERITSYTQLPAEQQDDDEYKQQPTGQWPTKGHIKMDSVSLRYGEKSPLVLQDITCDIPAGSKVGIVGRTGAGKSSLLRALFRLTEPQGSIVIDGVNITTLPLNKLRSSISIIPQDPVLFIGSLRKNLDPFEEFTEDKLWTALEQVELKSTVTALSDGLDTEMQEGGANMSVGQRQLVCLARALLKRTHILVMDEATANVDHQTDALIQRTLRAQFAHCTVLTIAHRLNTIMDSTHIMGLRDGRLVEFDSPHSLLQREDSLLTALVLETGADNAAHLRGQAQQADRQHNDTHAHRLPSFTS